MNNRTSFFLTALFLLVATIAFAQGGDPIAAVSPADSARFPASGPTAVSTVDRVPVLTGVQPSVGDWIAERLRYPELAKEYAIEGRVIIAYVIGTDGTLSDIRVHQKLGFGCEEAVLALFEKMPRWAPAVKNGLTVPVQCYTPIDFKLQ